MNKKILIIDDNPFNCEDYIAPLSESFDVTVYMSLRDAKRKVEMYNYDLIIIDIMMPTSGIKDKDELKTGLNFYNEELKPLESVKVLQILFWSNLSQKTYDDFFTAHKPDNVDFLHKELRNKNHLFEKVTELLK